MDATSGLPDYHYLGDALAAQRAVPKAWDEVTALFAGLPFAHEPGARWQWTISGFHLAGGLLERVSGMRYADYLRERVLAPAGLTRTFYCGDRDVTPGLARAYEVTREGFRAPSLESATSYPYHASVCSTARDVAVLARALRDGRLLTATSWRAPTTAEGAAGARPVPTDSTYRYGFGMRMSREDEHRWVGEHGRLMIQPLGESAEPLLAQGEHVFAVTSNPPLRFTFTVEGDRATALNVRGPNNAGASGYRVDSGR